MKVSRLWILLVALTPQIVLAWNADCGKEGKTPCAFSAAKFEGKQNGLCPSGQIFDLIEGGTCWTCPAGYGRTVYPVNGGSACEKVASNDFKRANENGKGSGWFGTDCASGQFWDIVDGNCHSCPAGYDMQLFEHVHSDRKCARGIPASFSSATKIGPPCGAGKLWDPRNGGECWSCPDLFKRTIAAVDSQYACEYNTIGGGTGLIGCEPGLISIRNVCVKRGECGKEGGRPCDVTERIPSCDANLREDFKTNKCVALRPGETPFTGGLSSLAGFWGATLQGRCKQLLGSIDIPGEGNTAVGLRCGKDVAVGFACMMVRDIAAGYTDLLNSTMEMVPKGGTLAQQMNAAANKAPCTDYRERFAKATRFGKATGAVMKVECPSGQFWDPDGNCYSCPADFYRTAYPVTHDRACTDRVGGGMLQFGCGAVQGIVANFDGPLKCEIEILENGSILEKKIDLKNADQAVCIATGELGYNIIKAGFEAGKAAATGDISGILATIGKIKGSASGGTEVKRLIDCRRQAMK